jgi:hypothetical protein
MTSRLIGEQGVTFRVSGDAGVFSIEIPKDLGLFNSERLVDRQDALLKYLLEASKRGPKPDPERKNRCEEFVRRVNEKEDAARYLSDFAKKHVYGDWIKQLESDYYYQDLCKGYKESDIREAEKVLYKYQINKAIGLTTWEHATSPLGVAQIMTAVEMNLRKPDGSLLSINTLGERYTFGGGHRWKNKPKK